MSKCVNCLKEINEKEAFCLTCHGDVLECAKQQIAELQKQLTITEKALELACETLQDINFKLYNTEMNFVDFFKQQAKEMFNEK